MTQNAPNMKSGSAEASDIHDASDVVFVFEPLLDVGGKATEHGREEEDPRVAFDPAARVARPGRSRGLGFGAVHVDDADRVAHVPGPQRVRHAPVRASLEVLDLEELVFPPHAGARVLGERCGGGRSDAPSLRYLAEKKQLPVPDTAEAIATEGPGHDATSLRRPRARRR